VGPKNSGQGEIAEVGPRPDQERLASAAVEPPCPASAAELQPEAHQSATGRDTHSHGLTHPRHGARRLAWARRGHGGSRGCGPSSRGHVPARSQAPRRPPGAYCVPPPPNNCPPGRSPRGMRDDAYCEPPPAKPCPPGTEWVSRSATDTFCRAGWRCAHLACPRGSTCRVASLCIGRVIRTDRKAYEVVSGSCESNAQGGSLFDSWGGSVSER